MTGASRGPDRLHLRPAAAMPRCQGLATGSPAAAGYGIAMARIEHLVTSGTFSLDGGTWEVDNNVWIVGDDAEVVVIDAAHDADRIAASVGTRRVTGIICTHGHDDHIDAAPDLARRTGAPILLHPADLPLWRMRHPDEQPSGELTDGQELTVAGVALRVLHTPGHSPGAVCLYAPALGTVFSGDTLFQGGPGATGRSFSDFPTIIESIKERLLTLPPDTVVRTGHGPQTTIGDEAPALPDWIARGH
jgi:glyoxylase-like metal-dependent hydrolase (beta-lactamase superfamily II)